MFVPRPLVVTMDMASKSPIGQLMHEKGLRKRLSKPKTTFLVTYLLQERKKEASLFSEYLDILPKISTDAPIIFTVEEQTLLKGSPFLSQANNKSTDNVESEYDLICSEVPDYKQFTLEEYSQARMLVSTRILQFTMNGVETDAFIPFADMLNLNQLNKNK